MPPRPAADAAERCETFLIDPPTVFCTGSLLAFVGHRQLVARRPNPFGASHAAALGFGLLWWAAVQYTVFAAPDWMLNYFVPVEQIPLLAVDAIFLVACLLASSAGHLLTALHLQRGRPLRAFLVLLAGAVVLFGLWGLTLDRYLHIGSFAEYQAGAAPLIPESAVAGGINAAGLVLSLGWGTMAALLWRNGRRLRAT